MLIKEYRVVLPFTVDEYKVGQLWSVAEASKNETGGGEGIEVVKNEPFKGKPLLGKQFSSGQYTYKIYHLSSKVPAFIRMLIPKGAMEVHEEAWNAYPYSRTVITVPGFMSNEKAFIEIATKCEAGAPNAHNNPGYMKDKFEIIIDSMHVDDDTGSLDNVHNLPPDKLKAREVIKVDISNDPVAASDYKTNEDPAKFKSKKTGRGPLKGDWISKVKPIMTAYKLVTCEFKWFGLQNRVEAFIQKSERRLFTVFHRQVFCWTDKWHGLTIEDIRAIEDKTKKELDEQRLKGEVRGMKGAE